MQFGCNNIIICPINKAIVFRLVLNYTHLCIGIKLHFILIAIQMVGGDVQKNSCIGTKIIHIVKLKRTNFDDIICMWSLSNLQSKAFSYVSCKRNIITCFFKYVINQRSGGGFAITSCDTYHL